MMLLIVLQCLINLLLLIMIVHLWWTSISSQGLSHAMKHLPALKGTEKSITTATESKTGIQLLAHESAETPCAFIKHVKILTKPSRKSGQLSMKEKSPRLKKQHDTVETTKRIIG